MTVRFHLFPFRTQKLSLLVPKIVSWKRLVKIGSRRLLYGPLVKRLRQRPLTPLTSVRFRYGSSYAPLAQLVEQLTLNQWAQGSSPWRCTTTTKSELFSDRRRVRIFCILWEKNFHWLYRGWGCTGCDHGAADGTGLPYLQWPTGLCGFDSERRPEGIFEECVR